jgi:hypothetical protein
MSDVALWLVPPVARRAEYATLIDALSEQFGTPRFLPHVTLLTGVAACDQTQLHTLAGALPRARAAAHAGGARANSRW